MRRAGARQAILAKVFAIANIPRAIYGGRAGRALVLSYTAMIYWTFRGKVHLDEHSS